MVFPSGTRGRDGRGLRFGHDEHLGRDGFGPWKRILARWPPTTRRQRNLIRYQWTFETASGHLPPTSGWESMPLCRDGWVPPPGRTGMTGEKVTLETTSGYLPPTKNVPSRVRSGDPGLRDSSNRRSCFSATHHISGTKICTHSLGGPSLHSSFRLAGEANECPVRRRVAVLFLEFVGLQH